MPASDFHFDFSRHGAAADLQPEHIADFQRMVKTLRHGSRFQLLFAEFTEATYRDALIQKIDQVLADLDLQVTRIELSQSSFTDFAALEAELRRLATDHGAIHLTGVDGWFDEGRWRDFNIRREAIAHEASVRLVIWLGPENTTRVIALAPDLWAWRDGVYAFASMSTAVREPLQPQGGPVDPRTLAERSRRIAVLRESLATKPPPDDEILGMLWDELADLLASIGDLDEALRLRREEQLPVYERLGDVREQAVTLGQIADVLQARGEYDEVLRIRREEQLPVYERLGDVRARAVTLGKIADVLQARGEYDEALRIRREEELPVYERLQSARDLLVCRANIGIIYLRRNLAGDRQKALELLNSALQDARRLNLPEAGQIAEIIRQA